MTGRAALAVAIVVALGLGLGGAACGGKTAATPGLDASQPAPRTPAEQMLALLPPGAQVVVELDLARLRANPVVGPLMAPLIAADAARALPGDLGGDPTAAGLARAELIVFAAYGVGTLQAATVTVIRGAGPIPGAVALSDGVVALGPAEWTAQLEARAMLVHTGAPVRAARDLLALRERAMPPKAPGASLRITARLSFDARVSLARQTGLEAAPAQLSVWADVVDDLAIVIDADATDPGERATQKSVARLQRGVRAALLAVASEPTVRALGVASSLASARLAVRGTWVRAIVAIGPTHLRRVVERATALLPAPAPARSPS